MEIRWRVWWERVGYGVLLIGAVAAVIAAVEGAMPTGSLPLSGGIQSSSGGSMISVLALVVAALAVFFGPARDAGERAAADPGDSAGNLDARVPGESCGIPFPLCRGGDDPHEAVR